MIFKLDPTLSSLLASTFIGGGGSDNAMALRLADNGDILVTGITASSNFPTTSGSFQASFYGGAATHGWAIPKAARPAIPVGSDVLDQGNLTKDVERLYSIAIFAS